MATKFVSRFSWRADIAARRFVLDIGAGVASPW
jgi:hypothetical protein